MGACLSCLNPASSSDETSPLLPNHHAADHDTDDPYSPSNPNFRASHHLLVSPSGDEDASGPSNRDRDPEDIRRERAAKEYIQRWASDQIVDVFPNMNVLTPAPGNAIGNARGPGGVLSGGDGQSRSKGNSSGIGSGSGGESGGVNRIADGADGEGDDGDGDGDVTERENVIKSKKEEDNSRSAAVSTHQDFLLSTIPGDRSKRSIRIYPPSRGNQSANTKTTDANTGAGMGVIETGSTKSNTSVSRSHVVGNSSETRRGKKGEGRAVVTLNIDLP